MSGSGVLHGPTLDRQDWLSDAACRGLDDPSLFTSPAEESTRSSAERTARAKTICQGCPAMIPCRTYAVIAREPDGIWGGLTPSERAALRRGKAP